MAFAHSYNLTITQAYLALSGFFREFLSFSHVFDCSAAQNLSLELTFEEIQSKLASPSDEHPLPFITGDCPGVVCYIEKSHPQLIPHLLKAPSVQHTQGVLVKRLLSRELGVQPSQIYHVAVAPCYDRKIEALRYAKDTPITDGSCLLFLFVFALILLL